MKNLAIGLLLVLAFTVAPAALADDAILSLMNDILYGTPSEVQRDIENVRQDLNERFAREVYSQALALALEHRREEAPEIVRLLESAASARSSTP